MTGYRITLPYACAMVETGDGMTIVKAAPILRWTIGWHVLAVAQWVNKEGGSMEMLLSGESTCL